MRNVTVFTIIFVSFTLTLSHGVNAKEDWFFHQKGSPLGLPVKSVVFYGNSTVIFEQKNEIWKWNLINNNQLRVDAGNEVSDIVIPKSNNSYIVYLKTNGQVGSLYTNNLAWRGGFTLKYLNDHMPHKIAVSGNGKRLVAIANGEPWHNRIIGRIQKWRLPSPMNVVYEGTDETERRVIPDIVLSSTGNSVFVADGDANIDQRGFKDGRIVGVYDPFIKGRVTELAINGNLLASAHSDNTLYLWNWGPNKWTKGISATKTSPVSCLELSKDGRYLATGHENGEIHIWNVSSGLLADSLMDSPHGINDIAFSDDGKYIAAGTGGSYHVRDRNPYLYIWRRQ